MAGCQAAATAINAAGGVLTDEVACTGVDTHSDRMGHSQTPIEAVKT